MKNIYITILLGLSALAGSAQAGDWPHFRGPDRSGAMALEALAKNSVFGFKTDWKRDLGSGYSCISVVGNTGVTMYSDGSSDLLEAFDTETGQQRWRFELGPMYKGHSGSQDGPTGTPTIHEGLVYALDPHGRLVAVTLAEGKKVWEHTLGKDVQARLPHYGFNTVPTVVGKALILMTGDEDGASFTAFDRLTGAQLWKSGDDTTTYQSPFLWERAGKTHILAVTDHRLMELDPLDGRILWQQDHDVLDNESYALPVLMGENRVLILNRRETAAFELTWQGEKAEMKELWRSNAFMRTYAIPVFHEGYLYGFRAQFLSCVNPENGEIMWRSRPPGGQGLILLGDHLLLIGKEGDLVAVEATAEAYREKARIKLFERGSYATPSYADGKLYLRNLKQMARVSITDHPTLAAKAEIKAAEPLGEFANFVAKVRRADDKQTLIDPFMARQKEFPIREGDRLVHYIYRGELSDLALIRGFGDEQLLARIEGTDFYFLSEELDPASHWEYSFSHFGDRIIDPLNPLVIGEGRGKRNELRMPKWSVPDHLKKPEGPRGRLEKIVFNSAVFDKERSFRLYLPAGFDKKGVKLPLVIFNNGEPALTVAQMDRSLDNLIGNRIAPVLVAFVPSNGDELMGDKRDAYGRHLLEEVIPHLEEHYAADPDSGTRTLMGVGRGAVISTYTALKNPGRFGKVANQSFIFPGPWGDELRELIRNGETPLSFYVEISSNDYKFPGLDAEADSKELVSLLKSKGHTVKTHHTAGAPGWGSWRCQTGIILENFYPKADM